MSENATETENEQVEDSTKKDTDADTTEAPEADEEKAWDPNRAKEKIRKLNSEAENLRKRLNEAPKADDVQAKDSKISELTNHTLRLEIGYELGLPLAVAKRLQGSTRDELIADAEELVEQFTPKTPPSSKPSPRLRGGGSPAVEPEETDLRKLGSRMFKK
jgi:hypothetical protein